MGKAMTAAALRAAHESAHPESLFFSRENMRFAGDTMSNFAVAADPVTFTTYSGETVTCWRLYRRRPVKHGLRGAFYFDCETFERRHRPDPTPTAV